MKQNVMAIINLEEEERDIRSLTAFRPVATVPISGRYRIIDFTLSNIVNAGIRQVGIFSKKSNRSLVDHISTGKPWDLNLKHSGLFLFDHTLLGYHNYDSKIFCNNMEFLKKSEADYVFICSSYMLCNLDLKQMIWAHCQSGNDITAVYKPTRRAYREFLNCDSLQIDSHGMVTGHSKNIGVDSSANISMEMFCMSKSLLIRLIYQAVRSGVQSSFSEFLMQNLCSYQTGGYCYNGYAACINSVAAYYQTNMELLQPQVRKELFSPDRPIYTKIKDTPPTDYREGSQVTDSLIADGCRLSGKVSGSVLSRFVFQAPDSTIQNCIILQGAVIQQGARLSHAIIEKNTVIHPGTVISGTPSFPVVIERKQEAALFQAV